eukprot:1778257-Rhodomonas_salina.4
MSGELPSHMVGISARHRSTNWGTRVQIGAGGYRLGHVGTGSGAGADWGARVRTRSRGGVAVCRSR